MKLIVGLGNLEKKFDTTRHNIGFELVDTLASAYSAEWSSTKLRSVVCTIQPENSGKIILAKPNTYMNNSGFAVTALLDYYKLSVEDLVVACDDFNIDLGTIRLRANGSHGGQNGLRHIIEQLGHDKFARLRLGIGPVPKYVDPINFVLAKFNIDEQEIMTEMIQRAMTSVLSWAKYGVEHAQRYNGKTDLKKEK